MSWRGVFVGSLALIALQAATSSDRSALRVGSMLEHLAGLVDRVLDPAVAAVPDLRGDQDTSGAAPAPDDGDGDDGGGFDFPKLPRPFPLPNPPPIHL